MSFSKTTITLGVLVMLMVFISLPTTTALAAPQNSTCLYYKVHRGDTMARIGRRYGVTVKELMRVNGLRKIRVRVGQRLCIPRHKPVAQDQLPAKHGTTNPAINNTGDGNTIVIVSGNGNKVTVGPPTTPIEAPPFVGRNQSWVPYPSPPGTAWIGQAIPVPGALLVRESVTKLTKPLGPSQTINIARAVRLTMAEPITPTDPGLDVANTGVSTTLITTITLAPRGPDLPITATDSEQFDQFEQFAVASGVNIGVVIVESQIIGAERSRVAEQTRLGPKSYVARVQSSQNGWVVSYVDIDNREAMSKTMSLAQSAPLSVGLLNAAIDTGSRWCRIWFIRWPC